MSLILYSHPLASFCHKVLVALYESGTPFRQEIVNFGDRAASAEFFRFWPLGKIPVLRDEARNQTIPETSVIIEYLDQHYPGSQPLLPGDSDARLETRLWDRFFDSYVHVPMQRIVADKLRSETERDPRTIEESRAMLATAYEMLDARMASRMWAAGDSFSLADCAAAPALFYSGIVARFDAHPHLAGYFDRLVERPSFKRVLTEARPYFQYYPFQDKLPARFLSD